MGSFWKSAMAHQYPQALSKGAKYRPAKVEQRVSFHDCVNSVIRMGFVSIGFPLGEIQSSLVV